MKLSDAFEVIAGHSSVVSRKKIKLTSKYILIKPLFMGKNIVFAGMLFLASDDLASPSLLNRYQNGKNKFIKNHNDNEKTIF